MVILYVMSCHLYCMHVTYDTPMDCFKIQLSYFVDAIYVFFLLHVHVCSEHTGWDIRCLGDWSQMCNLSIHGILMMCLEWWSFEIVILLAGNVNFIYHFCVRKCMCVEVYL